jgi:hypothetical protein
MLFTLLNSLLQYPKQLPSMYELESVASDVELTAPSLDAVETDRLRESYGSSDTRWRVNSTDNPRDYTNQRNQTGSC